MNDTTATPTEPPTGTPGGPTSGSAPAGVDLERVTARLLRRVPGLRPPLSVAQVAGGHSNLTFIVTDTAGRRVVLRRPPLGHVLASAHDMAREARIMSALAPTPVPVPPVLDLCEEPTVNGAPFTVMDFVPGTVIRTAAQAEALGHEGRQRAATRLVEVLAAIHAVDVDAVGLGDLGRRDAYAARQLRRWHRQLEATVAETPGLNLPGVFAAHERLVATVPPEQPATLVHGDYRLDNCLLDEHGGIAAVLDWELCTLGQPLADLGLLCVYWTDPGEDPVLAGTATAGFGRRDELVERYAAVSGRDVSTLEFWVALGCWKLTCIIAGVYSRYLGGAMGEAGRDEAAGFRTMLEVLGERTATAVAKLEHRPRT